MFSISFMILKDSKWIALPQFDRTKNCMLDQYGLKFYLCKLALSFRVLIFKEVP